MDTEFRRLILGVLLALVALFLSWRDSRETARLQAEEDERRARKKAQKKSRKKARKTSKKTVDAGLPNTPSVPPAPDNLPQTTPKTSTHYQDLLDVLLSLGYKKQEAKLHAAKALTHAPEAGLEELIRLALASAQGRLF